jgi:hypothetical protein
MSFIAAQPAAPEPALTNHPFWPGISPSDFRAAYAVDGTVTAARLSHALTNAVLHVNSELADFRARHEAAGISRLADVPGQSNPGMLEYLYRRAVYESVNADLMERMIGYDATANGQKRAESQEPAIDDHYRNSLWAVRDILGKRRTTVELI